MGSDLLKPPCVSAWLLLLLCASLVAQSSYPEPFGTIAGGLFIVGGIFALSVVFRWLGVLMGLGLGAFSRGFASGFENGRTGAQREREERGQ